MIFGAGDHGTDGAFEVREVPVRNIPCQGEAIVCGMSGCEKDRGGGGKTTV